MRKFILMLAVFAATITANAQERGFYGNKFTDNWYIGVGGGVATKTTHKPLTEDLNPGVQFKIGKYFSPIFGVGFEGQYMNTSKPLKSHFESKYHSNVGNPYYYQVGIFASVNLMNSIKGYYGEPRFFEIQPQLGFYWGHNATKDEYAIGTIRNTLVNKLAFDFFFNLGKKKMFQIFIEPSLNYVIAGAESENVNAQGVGNQIVLYNLNNSFLGLNAGINYKFLTSNGSHNFMVVEACDQSEIDDLNTSINNLRNKAVDDDNKIADLENEIQRLKDALRACQEKPCDPCIPELELPVVFYPLNKSIIRPDQEVSVQKAAEVLKKHPEIKIHVKGYASPEGPHDNNTSLGIRRSNAVKTMLVEKYGIEEERITTEGCGETDKLYKVFELNRVAIMILVK